STPDTQNRLSDTTVNQGTLTLATGRDFQRFLSRVTADASQTDTNSSARNTRLTIYDDLQYRIRPNISALGRIGFEDINYPAVPSGSFTGVAWQIGGRLDFRADTDYAILRYGKQEGIYGYSSSVRYQITPATVVTAAVSQGIESQQQLIQSNLTDSRL